MISSSTQITSLLILLLVVKISWFISIGILFILKYNKDPSDKDKDKDKFINIVELLEQTLHSLFLLLISMLLIYLFNHLTPKKVCIEGQSKIYLYSFGILVGIGSFKKLIYNLIHNDQHSKTMIELYKDLINT